MPKPESSVLNVRDMNTMITSAPLASSVLNVRNMDTLITSALWRFDMLILYLVMMLTIRRLLKTPRSSEISSVVEEPLVNPDASIIDEAICLLQILVMLWMHQLSLLHSCQMISLF